MGRRRRLAVLLATAITLAVAGPTAANTGPNQPTTDVSQVLAPISFVGGDGRTYSGAVFVQRDNLAGVATAGFSWTWRNAILCDNGTPEPEDDFEAEELIDFTADSIVPTSFALASNLSASAGTLTGTGHRIHMAGCEGTIVEDVVESHTVTFDLAAVAPATRVNSRERIDNGDGTITTIVVREIHRAAGGSFAIDGAGGAVGGADLAHVQVSESTR